MDFDLDSLGSRNFEHVAQALAQLDIGPGLSSFGDGADGGREATWNGVSPSLGDLPNWTGYGVVQAKFRLHPTEPKDNLQWLKKTVVAELKDWSDTERNRLPKPDYLLFVTNVRLSPGAGGGKDEIKATVKDTDSSLHLETKEVRIWDYDDLRTRLINAKNVRTAYAAFLTPGDIIARLVEDLDWKNELFGNALVNHAARTLLDDNSMNLTQAGAVSDLKITISDVVVDLPAELSSRSLRFSSGHEVGLEGVGGIASRLIEVFNQRYAPDDVYGTRRVVVIGGPGQGKSTVTQWLSQIYRTGFIRDTSVLADPDLARAICELDRRVSQLQFPALQARRWPFRVILTEFADYLARTDGGSVLEFIANSVSKGSPTVVGTSDILKWLRSYPWLLLIDGLDEVPSTSNRSSVMLALRDFFISAATVEADVAVVATTRPQGYNDEFPPDKYIEYHLTPLDRDTALEYAGGLVAMRHGAGTSMSLKVNDRLARAIQDVTTAKLMETPLQITILTVLLEKLGHAPQQRWRLFSQYYKVITQREQEKGGELSELLQRYETDVDYLHRYIGNLLQLRNSEAGDASATIDKNEFEQIIVRRLENQGHDAPEVERLRIEFSRLVTNRLVFLALLTSETIGFELRSLQEFMAAEWVVSSPESKVIPQLRALASSSYWRNVSLFIAGAIFASRESLKADVANLCFDLNLENATRRILKPGSDLALDILLDGSANSQPGYVRTLAKTACEMLEGPKSRRLQALASVSDPAALEIIRSVAHESSTPAKYGLCNRASLLSYLAISNAGGDDIVFLSNFLRISGAAGVNPVAEIAISERDFSLIEVLEEYVQECDPAELLRLVSSQYPVGAEAEILGGDEGEMSWLQALLQLVRLNGGKHRDIHLGQSSSDHRRKDGAYLFSFVSVEGGNLDAWQWVLKTKASHGGWPVLRDIAQFCIEPNENTLSTVLGNLTKYSKDTFPYALALPWVLKACIKNAKSMAARDGEEAYNSQLEFLSFAAREGNLGNYSIWLMAERRWSEGIDLQVDVINSVDDGSSRLWDNPLPSSLEVSGTALTGMQLRATSVGDFQQKIALITYLIDKVLPSLFGAQRVSVLDAVSFFAGVVMNNRKHRRNDDEVVMLNGLRERLLAIDWTEGAGSIWPLWLGMDDFPVSSEAERRLLLSLGSMPRFRIHPGRHIAEHLKTTREWIGDAEMYWPILRIEFTLTPLLATKISVECLPKITTDPAAKEVVDVWDLSNSPVEEILDGLHDALIIRVCTNNNSSLGLNWFTAYVTALGGFAAVELTAYASALLVSRKPEVSEQLFAEGFGILGSIQPVLEIT